MAGNKISKIIFLTLGCALVASINCSLYGETNKADEHPKDNLTQIIHYGSLAPSSHNAQMWQVKIITENKIKILVDRKHILPQVDPENRETLISLGAFIENMVLAAPCFGLQPEVSIITKNPADTEIAELTFCPKRDHSSTDILRDIKNRHTIRIPYMCQALSAQDAQWFKTFGADLRYFALSTQEGKYIQQAIIQATKQQVADDNKQKELAGLFRFSKKEAEKERDGLTPDGIGLSGITKWFVSTFFTHDSVMSKSFRNQSVTTTKRQAENCSGFVVLTSDDDSVASLVASGRSLERFLITATGKKLAVHPMSAPLEESPWSEEISQKVGLDKPVQMILRVGYVKDYGHPVSMRREVLVLTAQ
ncbi:MAG TPA: hypothetical protein DDW65_14390 [Firmicutes bacterium]|nr:hypothetical protein [Bacillota bacterium]